MSSLLENMPIMFTALEEELEGSGIEHMEMISGPTAGWPEYQPPHHPDGPRTFMVRYEVSAAKLDFYYFQANSNKAS